MLPDEIDIAALARSSRAGIGRSTSAQQAQDELYQQYYASVGVTTSSIYSLGEFKEIVQRKEDVDAQIKQENDSEKAFLDRFIKTGEGSGKIYGNDEGQFCMIGQDRKPTHVLFYMDNETILANKTRSKHLKTLLEKLAKREGLKLEMTKDVPDVPGNVNRVGYLALPKQGDVDDTGLVSKGRLRDFSNSPEYEACDNCGHCGDPSCRECSFCSSCSLEEEQEEDMFEDWDD